MIAEVQVTKGPTKIRNLRRSMQRYTSARNAFEQFMRECKIGASDKVLLPSYIGWSAREGSGVFDPISKIGCKVDFYQIKRDLSVDVDDFARQLTLCSPKLVLLIHYFGFPDSRLPMLVKLAKDAGVTIVEDAAHAMLSDLIGGSCGRFGDATIYSLHKILPVESGGVLVINKDISHPGGVPEMSEYDLFEIARRRRSNAESLIRQLAERCPDVEPIHSTIPPDVFPQTLPIIVNTCSRDDLYFEMNAAGWGVVSLYHTLIDRISESIYPDSHWLSKHIMNLPVHQDTNPTELASMVSFLSDKV